MIGDALTLKLGAAPVCANCGHTGLEHSIQRDAIVRPFLTRSCLWLYCNCAQFEAALLCGGATTPADEWRLYLAALGRTA